MSYFVPVLPDECADTVRGTFINASELNSSSSLPVQDKSSLIEIEHEDKLWQNKSFTFNSQTCREKGDNAEQLFLDACNKQKWTQKHFKEAQEYDYKHHVDCIMKINDKELWVDVKCCRSLRRGWAEQSEYMWVELNNNGWLFGGKANVIAQKINDAQFALLDRLKLCDYVKATVQVHLPIVPYPEQSYMRVYLRDSKKNGFTLRHALSLISLKDAFLACGCGVI